MEGVCPICNGLIIPVNTCDICRGPMDDVGKVEDYFGPYSPYMGEEDFDYNNRMMVIGDQQCVHIFRCHKCQRLIYRPYLLEFI